MCRAYINRMSYWKNLAALLVRKDCSECCVSPRGPVPPFELTAPDAGSKRIAGKDV
jgi:hypothetical protein